MAVAGPVVTLERPQDGLKASMVSLVTMVTWNCAPILLKDI